MYVIHEGLRFRPKCRVELHIHLDGAIRHETIWEIMRKKEMSLPGDGSLKRLKQSLLVKEPENLHLFLQAFSLFLPAFQGDLEAIERFSFEFVEDQSDEDIAYCEARLCPHLLLLPQTNSLSNQEEKEPHKSENGISVRDILEASLRGIKRGEEKYGTKVRLILCCIHGSSDWSWEILELCEEYRNKGVVGIDFAGSPSSGNENLAEIEIFQKAKSKGIHRTVHAGEAGDWKSVEQAIDVLGAQRIGHGYRVLENEDLYRRCLKEKIHFEICPHSSYLTGAIKSLDLGSKRHPILRLAEDGASFSINSDDPTLTGTHVSEEYDLLRKWGFNEALLARANFEAAKNSFLPPDEKKELISSLEEAYGVKPSVQID